MPRGAGWGGDRGRSTLARCLLAVFCWIASLPALFALAPSNADAARIVTWEGPRVAESRFVDPAAAPEGSSERAARGAGATRCLASRRLSFRMATGTPSRAPLPGPLPSAWPGRRFRFVGLDPANGDLFNAAHRFTGVIVMPEGHRGFYTNWWNGGEARRPRPGSAAALDQLVPFVEKRLRIKPGRRWRAIGRGFSMGGAGAMFYASQRPGYFGCGRVIFRPASHSACGLPAGVQRGDRPERSPSLAIPKPKTCIGGGTTEGTG